jgi:hypothetical protein
VLDEADIHPSCRICCSLRRYALHQRCRAARAHDSVAGCVLSGEGMAEVRKSITALYQDFEAAHSAAEEAPDAKTDVAIGKCRKIAAQLVKLPAENIDEVILKRVALRCAGAMRSGETLTSIDGWKAGVPGDHRPDYEPEQFDCLCSLRDDLLRMVAGSGTRSEYAPEPITTDRRP